jgi:hypothetical protein
MRWEADNPAASALYLDVCFVRTQRDAHLRAATLSPHADARLRSVHDPDVSVSSQDAGTVDARSNPVLRHGRG